MTKFLGQFPRITEARTPFWSVIVSRLSEGGGEETRAGCRGLGSENLSCGLVSKKDGGLKSHDGFWAKVPRSQRVRLSRPTLVSELGQRAALGNKDGLPLKSTGKISSCDLRIRTTKPHDEFRPSRPPQDLTCFPPVTLLGNNPSPLSSGSKLLRLVDVENSSCDFGAPHPPSFSPSLPHLLSSPGPSLLTRLFQRETPGKFTRSTKNASPLNLGPANTRWRGDR